MSNFAEFRVYIDPRAVNDGSPAAMIQINPDHVTQIYDLGDHCGIEKDNGKIAEVWGTAAEAMAKLKTAA